jgi:hypothetical protein
MSVPYAERGRTDAPRKLGNSADGEIRTPEVRLRMLSKAIKAATVLKRMALEEL